MLGDLQLLLPSYEEQMKINHFLDKIDKKTDSIQLELSEIKLFKKGLLQKCLYNILI